MKICSQEIHGCVFTVVIVQMLTWTLVSVILFNRGLTNLVPVDKEIDAGNLMQMNKTELRMEYPVIKGYSAGIVILIIATVMMIIGPIFLIAVIIEKCYERRRFQKVPQEDAPPNYEDVVLEEMPPHYTTLFLNIEVGESSNT